MQNHTIQISKDLTSRERGTLQCVARAMIPPSAGHGLPGADDPAIFNDILQSIERDRMSLRDALHIIDDRADGGLADCDKNAQHAILSEFRNELPDLAGVLEAAIARCYYRDTRVMIAIGMETRPPFPLGYEISDGDWSLLDPVRLRGKVYRDAD